MKPLSVVRTRPVEVKQQTIEMLEKWLERAKAGEINGITIVVTYTGEEGVTYETTRDCGLKHLGGLMFAQQRIVNDF